MSSYFQLIASLNLVEPPIGSYLGISAAYELLEWAVAVLTGTQADAFLGTQGYVWDTQSDMFLALIGSLAAMTLLRVLGGKNEAVNRI